MPSFNKVILMGNMVADPELRQTPSGLSVCTFSIAVQRRFSRAQENEKTTDFFTVNAWDKNAEFVCRYFKKGSPILVCGQLQTRTWTDNQGQKRYATDVVADEVTFTSSVNQAGGVAPGMTDAPATYSPSVYGNPSFNSASDANFEEIPNDATLPF